MSAEKPAGRAPGIIERLFAFVRAYGIASPELGMRFIAMRAPVPALVIIVDDPAKSQMLVAAGHIGYSNPVRVELTFGQDGIVTWDPDVGVDDLQVFLDAMDGIMAEQGHYDPATGARTRPPEWMLDALLRRRIEFVFDGPMARMRVATDDAFLADAIRKQFDRPDDLAVFTNCFGEVWLCRKEDHDEFLGRDAVMARLAPAFGAKSEADLDAMPPERKASYVAAFMKEYAKLPN